MAISNEKIDKFVAQMLKRILILIFFIPNLMSAQTLKGIVTDKNNLPIEAVNVSVIGKQIGSSTNEKGEYQLQLKANRSFVISFTFIGYEAIKIHPRQLGLKSIIPLRDVLEYCYKHEITVFLCTYYYCDSKGWPSNDFLSELAQLITLFPVKLVLLHGGGVRLLEFAEFVRFNENVILDLSLTLMKYRGSSLDMDLKFLFKNFDRRICVGSDHPEYLLSDVLMQINNLADELELCEVKLDNIAYNNLNKMLGL